MYPSNPTHWLISTQVQRLLKRDGVNYLYHNVTDEKVGRLGVLLGKLAKPTIKLFVGIDFGRLTTLSEMDELMKCAPEYDDEVLLSCSCSVIEIQTSSITNRWYRFWSRVGIFLMQCAGTVMTQHLITIKKVAGPRPGAVRIVTPSGSRDAIEREDDAARLSRIARD